MAYTISLPTITYRTMNGEFTVTKEQQKTGDSLKVRFSIVATGTNLEKTTDWVDIPISDPIGLIKNTMPSITDNLPLIEANDKGRGLVCSAYLLQGGKEIKLYLPISTTAKQLSNIIARHDQIQLSDGERVYTVSYKEIEALIIA